MAPSLFRYRIFRSPDKNFRFARTGRNAYFYVTNQIGIESWKKKFSKPFRKRVRCVPGDIAAAAGVEKAEADKAIKKLVKEGKVYSPKRCFYDIQK